MWTNRNCFFISKIDIWPLIKFHILSISLLRREFNIKKWMVSLCATMLYHTLIIIKMASLKISHPNHHSERLSSHDSGALCGWVSLDGSPKRYSCLLIRPAHVSECFRVRHSGDRAPTSRLRVVEEHPIRRPKDEIIWKISVESIVAEKESSYSARFYWILNGKPAEDKGKAFYRKQKHSGTRNEETLKMNNEKKKTTSCFQAERKAKVDGDNCFAAIITAMTNKKRWKEDRSH